MAKIDKLTGLFKMSPEEEKENEDNLVIGENLLKGMEQLEKAGINFGALKDQVKGGIQLLQSVKDFTKIGKP